MVHWIPQNHAEDPKSKNSHTLKLSHTQIKPRFAWGCPPCQGSQFEAFLGPPFPWNRARPWATASGATSPPGVPSGRTAVTASGDPVACRVRPTSAHNPPGIGPAPCRGGWWLVGGFGGAGTGGTMVNGQGLRSLSVFSPQPEATIERGRTGSPLARPQPHPRARFIVPQSETLKDKIV